MAWYETLSNDELLDELHKVEDMQDHVCRYYEDMYEELEDKQRSKDYSKGISNQMLSSMERGRVLSDRWLELANEVLKRHGL